MTAQELINSYRLELLKSHSKVTVKNYLSDIYHFTNWFANKFGCDFSPDLLSKTVIEEYEISLGLPASFQSSVLSHKSLKRHLSSLRSFTAYLISTGLLETNPFHKEETIKKDNWKLKDFKNHLYENKASDLTIKYYINDISAFIIWFEKVYPQKESVQIPNISPELFFDYASRLKTESGLSPRSINRKLSSLRKYLSFIKSVDFSKDLSPVKNLNVQPVSPIPIENLAIAYSDKSYSSFLPLRTIQKLLNFYDDLENKTAEFISSTVLSSKMGRLSGKITYSQPIDKIASQLGSYRIKKEFYAPYSISTSSFPLHKKILYHLKYTRPQWYKTYHTYTFVHYLHMGVLVIFAVGISMFLYNYTIGEAGAQSNLQTQAKTFIFKGRLLDKNGNPVSSSTDIRLALYNSALGEESSALWKETQTSVTPDAEGNVMLTVGSRNQIPQSLLDQNQPLYLGIGIGNEKELSPRQQIGVPFATSAQNVQGFIPISNTNRQTNVLLALDASGVLNIGGSAGTVFQATGGDFTLSGQTLILSTNASSDGNIVLNPDGNGKIDILKPLTSSNGKISAQSAFDIQANSNTDSALSISQNGPGSFIFASSSGKTKFEVNNQGVITRGEWAGAPIGTEFGGFGTSITATGPGELLYSTSNTTYGHLSPGIAGDCLVSNGRSAPLWSPCGFLSQLNGTLTVPNTTLDLILGSTSTSSAKFAFKNMSSGTPTLTIGSTLNINSSNIESVGVDLKLGSDTKNVLLASSGGNVGVGTDSPTRTLDIKGNFGGNVDYYSDGSNNQTIIRSTKALIYDLEKNTGTSDTSTTTTYNITGLPNNDGTIAYIYTKVSKASTLAPQSQTLVLQINGIQLSSISTANVTSSDTTIKHYTAVRSNSTWHLMGSYGDSDTADLAEWTEFEGEMPEAGSILSISSNGRVKSSNTPHDSKLAGIVSTNPNILIGPQTDTSVKLALSGRIPAIVTSITGQIREGDNITSSPLSGIGMKPQESSAVVGKAIEAFLPNDTKCIEIENTIKIPWPEDDGTNRAKPCFKLKVENLSDDERAKITSDYGYTAVDYIYIGKIMVLSSLSWSSSEDFIASVDDATVSVDEPTGISSLDSEFAVQLEELNSKNPTVKTANKTFRKVSAFGGVVAGKIKAGTLSAVNITTKNLTATRGIFDESITSPLAKVDEIKTDIISPNKTGKLAIELPPKSALTVRNNQTNKEVAKIDSEGNASFSGTLASENLETSDASISGTLRTNNLIADNILGLDEKVSTLAAQIISDSKPVENAVIPELSKYLNENSVVAKFGTFKEGLLSLGASTFGSLSVMDQLSLGTTFVLSNNSINTLGSELSIQPLKQGAISFLAGALRIETDGKITISEDTLFKKDVRVQGKIFANDLVASGSASFNKINFNLVEQAFAVDQNSATATTSAGTAVIKANFNELTISNPLVTDKSLIYITPANNTNNNVIFLMRQTPEDLGIEGTEGSFTVGVSTPITTDTLFNWLIVN